MKGKTSLTIAIFTLQSTREAGCRGARNSRMGDSDAVKDPIASRRMGGLAGGDPGMQLLSPFHLARVSIFVFVRSCLLSSMVTYCL